MSALDLSRYGIEKPSEILYNPDYETLFREETDLALTGYEKGTQTSLGAVNVMTGVYTGRSPKDKYFVMDDVSRGSVWWTSPEYPNDNKPCSQETWNTLKQIAVKELSGKRLFVVDAFCGANPATRLKVRFVMEVAWQAHFVRNMFIRPSREEQENFGEPDFLVLTASKARVSDYKKLGLHSETAVVFNLQEKCQIILNTWYGGEMKKGMFSVMNYLNPLRSIASMHCSANTDLEGKNTAIFFGLSGTGKTTLSTDPKRLLIGDDEHGWDDDGVFNYEGGCYAKVIDLDKESEPDIYGAIRRDALLENVTVRADGEPDFSDSSATENTRVSYPIGHIRNIVRPVSRGPHAKDVIFLTADAYGVLPPVSVLTTAQAQYYFLSGYTSKVAGTEIGVTKPVPTFSACFGGAFLSLHPFVYARELARKIEQNGSAVYLVNTGWNGRGKRISIRDTRAIIDAILDGSIRKAGTRKLPYFDLAVPTALPGVSSEVLDPRNAYEDSALWVERAEQLVGAFNENFRKFLASAECRNLVQSGPDITKKGPLCMDAPALCAAINSEDFQNLHPITLLSAASSLITQKMPGVAWVGFYFSHAGTWVLGPHQGTGAPVRLVKDKGFYASATMTRSKWVSDASDGSVGGLISDLSLSAGVIPVFTNYTKALLCVESRQKDRFSASEIEELEAFGKLIAERLSAENWVP